MSKKEETKEMSADEKFYAMQERMLAMQEQMRLQTEAFIEAAKSSSLSPSQLEGILERTNVAAAHGMQKAIRPENEIPPLKSAFNPDGDNVKPKRKLSRKTFLNGYPEHDSDTALSADRLLQAEIDSYNALGSFLESQPERRTDTRNGLYRAELRNRNSELHIEIPVATLDARANLPPTLIMLCHELETGESMSDLNALLSEVTRLRAEVERLGGSVGTRPFKIAAPVTITAPAGPLVSDLQKALDQTPESQLAGV